VSVVFSTGTWRPKEGEEDAFVEAWTEFGQWITTMDGAGGPQLTRDLADPVRYFSFCPWRDADAMTAWRSNPEFSERLGRVRAHVDEFKPADLEQLVAIEGAAQPS
jgi:heme-degrading monooxygenase HmoA